VRRINDIEQPRRVHKPSIGGLSASKFRALSVEIFSIDSHFAKLVFSLSLFILIIPTLFHSTHQSHLIHESFPPKTTERNLTDCLADSRMLSNCLTSTFIDSLLKSQVFFVILAAPLILRDVFLVRCQIFYKFMGVNVRSRTEVKRCR